VRSSSFVNTLDVLCRRRNDFPEVHEAIAQDRWPGDVSELQTLIERAVMSAREPVLEIDGLP
jgi:DNA-binding NtrC family response regulator